METEGLTRYMSEKDAMAYLSMSRLTLRKWCDEIGATRRLAQRAIRYDRCIIDSYLDAQAGTIKRKH